MRRSCLAVAVFPPKPVDPALTSPNGNPDGDQFLRQTKTELRAAGSNHLSDVLSLAAQSKEIMDLAAKQKMEPIKFLLQRLGIG